MYVPLLLFFSQTLFHAVYSWKINGQKEQTDNQYFTHMFSQAGNYELELTVSYIGGIEENTITLSVTKRKYTYIYMYHYPLCHQNESSEIQFKE